MSVRVRHGRKLTIISMYYAPESGAASVRLTRLAIGLLERRYHISVLTALPNYPTGRIFSGYRHRLCHTEMIDGILVKRYWLYPSRSTSAAKRIANMISLSITLLLSIPYLIRARPDTVVINSPPLLVALTGSLLAKLVCSRVVLNVSDIWPLSALELGAIRRNWLYSALERTEKVTYRLSDAVAAQSSETLHHIQAICPRKRTFLYRNLDSPSEFIHEYPPIDQRPIRIVYAGLLGVAQGIYEICSNINFKALDCELHIYGDGNERGQIAHFVAGGKDQNVFLHEVVAACEIPRILSRFHATIIPLTTHIQGAFPSKIYTAISAALPVHYCGDGEAARFVKENGIGWITGCRDYEGLRRNIDTMKKLSEQDYTRLREHITKLALGPCNLYDQLDRFEAFVDSLERSR